MGKQDIGERVAALRDEITAARATCVRLEAAPVPLAEAVARLDARLDELAAACDLPALGMLTAPNPERTSWLFMGPRGDDLEVLLAAVVRDSVRAECVRRLGALYASLPEPIASADRPRRLATARATLRALEVREEQEIMRAEDTGVEITRRPDADPEVVLTTTLEAAA